MLFGSHLAAFCTAFSTILPCILHQNALRFAPYCTAFCTKTQCILRHFVLQLATISPKNGINDGYFK